MKTFAQFLKNTVLAALCALAVIGFLDFAVSMFEQQSNHELKCLNQQIPVERRQEIVRRLAE